MRLTWTRLDPPQPEGPDGLTPATRCSSGPVQGLVVSRGGAADATEVALSGGGLPTARLRTTGRGRDRGLTGEGGTLTVDGVAGRVRRPGRGLGRAGRSVHAEVGAVHLLLRRRGLGGTTVERPDGSAVLRVGAGAATDLDPAAGPAEQAVALLLWFGVGRESVSLL